MKNQDILVIFDLDGVLMESKMLHFEALNKSLAKFNISITYEEHLEKYDGLPTKRKLEILNEEKGLDKKFFKEIWEEKQTRTIEVLDEIDIRIEGITELVKEVSKDYMVMVASNSIRSTVEKMLQKIDVINDVDYFVSNDDVKFPKPYPEMYWQCMLKAGVTPKQTVIIEDSFVGRKGALDSGANLFAVKNPRDLVEKNLPNYLKKFDNSSMNQIWTDPNINVLIPCAGAGSRFAQAGYTFPKPLIEVFGKPMIQVVVESLAIEGRFIFIIQKEHNEKYNMKSFLKAIRPNCEVIEISGVTEGAACTTLLAKEFINNDNPLVIANSDQYIKWNASNTMYNMSESKVDGGILTFKATHPKWSYAKSGDDGFVTEVAEKQVISEDATVGVYYWGKGTDYVKYAEDMIQKDIRVNNEFYVCPVFNQAIEEKKKIKVYDVEEMWGLGTPEDLDFYHNHFKN